MDALDVTITIAFAPAGFVVGWVYFSLMRYSLIHLGKEKTGIMQFVGFAFLRMLLFAGGLLGAFLASTWCFLAYVLGFIVARTISVGRARTPPGQGFSPPASESRKHNG